MKRSLIKLTCMTLLATASSFAFAADEAKPLSIKAGMGFDQGFGVTAQFNDTINAFVGNDGVSADYLLKQGKFDEDIPFDWYVGAGGAINWDGDNEYSARVPLGITLPFAKLWHVYAQAAPNLAYQDKTHNSGFKFGVDFALGIRYAF